MKITKEIEKLENSSVKLTVTVAKADVASTYTSSMTKYSKELQLPGFRKGKVPLSVLEMKYGKEIKNDVAGELIEKALEEIFAEMDKEKSDLRPLAYSQPQLAEMPELDPAKNLTFVVTYDIMPEVKVSDFDGIEIKEPQVKLTDDDIKDELESIRERNAMVIDKKDTDAAEKGDIATMDYTVTDADGKEITNRPGFVETLGSDENTYDFDDEVIGMKKDETKEFSKTYKDDDSNKEIAGKTLNFKVTLKTLKLRQLPDLDDELAQDVNEKYKTLEDLKNDIKKNMQTSLDNKIREIKTSSLVDQLVEKNPVSVPQSLLNAELESRWQMMARQFQCTVEQLNKFMASAGQKKEDMLKEWSADAEKTLKGRIIIESLLKEKKYECSDEELEAEFGKIAAQAGVSVEEVKKHYTEDSSKEYLKDNVREDKLY
ncbi:MAG: trigger factor, partial [Treponemataceae bacterium]|nr:trigger factor [Treponemataceae bacterium]